MLTVFLFTHKHWVCAWVSMSASLHAWDGNVVCPACALLTGNPSFRCCHCCSSVIFRFTLMQGPHQRAQTQKHVASDSWSLIKSPAFVIIQNWLKNKGGIHGIKNKCSFQSTSVQMGPWHTARLLLVIEFVVDLGPGPPQLFTGAALQCLLKSL